eukprot:SAG31_NODE_21137_length_557_cov_0.796943_1_plen_75_part_00
MHSVADDRYCPLQIQASRRVFSPWPAEDENEEGDECFDEDADGASVILRLIDDINSGGAKHLVEDDRGDWIIWS